MARSRPELSGVQKFTASYLNRKLPSFQYPIPSCRLYTDGDGTDLNIIS